MQPGSLKERDDEGFAPDNNDDSLNPANRQNPDNTPAGGFWNPEGWNDEYPGDDVARPNKKRGSGIINPNLGAEESDANPISGNTTPGLNGAENALSNSANFSSIDTSRLSAPASGWNKTLVQIRGLSISRKDAARIGGGTGLLSVFITLVILSTSLLLVHLKNLVLGSTNRAMSTVGVQMQKRRLNSTVKILKGTQKELQKAAYVAKLEAAGVQVVKDDKGKILRLELEGAKLEIAGKSGRQSAKEVSALYRGTDAEIKLVTTADKAAREVGTRWTGPLVKKNVFERRLKITHKLNWLEQWRASRTKPPTNEAEAATKAAVESAEATNPNNLVARAYAESAATEAASLTNESAALATKAAAEQQAAEPGTVPNPSEDLLDGIPEEVTRLEDDLSNIDNLGKPLVATAEEVGKNVAFDSAESLTKTFSVSDLKNLPKKALESFAKKFPKTAAFLALSTVDPTTIMREGCRTKGTLNFVRHVATTYLAIELARFAVRYLTIADNQQAGLITGESVKLMSIYMKGAAGSTGIQSLLGNGSVSPASLSSFSVGFGNTGLFGAISSFLEKIPGLGGTSCSIVTNPLVQVGSTFIGGGIGILTGGTSTAVGSFFSSGTGITTALAMTLANELLFGIVTPILIRSVTGALLSGLESPEQMGSILRSGGDVLGTMSFGSVGGLAAPAGAFSGILGESDRIQKYEKSQQSIAERYFDMSNTDSLLARASLTLPVSLTGFAGTFQGQMAGGIFSSLGGFFSDTFGNKTYAALGSNKCDVSAEKFNVAVTDFCSPIMGYVPILDLDQTEKILIENQQINLDGTPVPGSDYEKFIGKCFSGRTDLLHPEEFDKDGGTDPIDPTCVAWAEYGDFLGKFDNDMSEPVDGPDKPERVPTKKERFAAWYGFMADDTNIEADVTNNLSGSASNSQTNNKIYFLGDSTTVGMQNLAGTDPTKDYLKRTFDASGWNSLVNAQGCRGIYQPQGPIAGDGSSCPAESIVDGITALNNDLPTVGNDAYGTFVIGLGGNAYERDASGNINADLFTQKATQLINTIKQNDPTAFIYWVNLTSSDNNQTRLNKNTLLQNVISSYPADQNVKLLDWNDYVQTVNSTPETTDDVGFADTVHHTADGYKKKVDWLLKNIPRPGGSLQLNLVTGVDDTTNIECAAGTINASNVDGYESGIKRRIKICDAVEQSQSIKWVNSQISEQVVSLLKKAVADNIPIGGGAWRPIDTQLQFWKERCGPDYPITQPWDPNICHGARLARPGYSMHQMGLGIDFTCGGNYLTTDDECFRWLEQNAKTYGLLEWGNSGGLAVSPKRNKDGYEAWHWSINGN